MVYYSLQILAAIFYLKSKALGFILSINIIGLFLLLYQKATLVVHQGEVLLVVASKKPGSCQTFEREAHD